MVNRPDEVLDLGVAVVLFQSDGHIFESAEAWHDVLDYIKWLEDMLVKQYRVAG